MGSLLFLLYTSELFSILVNKLVGYADDLTLTAVVPSPTGRRLFPNRDLGKVSKCFDLWRIRLKTTKTKAVIVSRSRSMDPTVTKLTIVAELN